MADGFKMADIFHQKIPKKSVIVLWHQNGCYFQNGGHLDPWRRRYMCTTLINKVCLNMHSLRWDYKRFAFAASSCTCFKNKQPKTEKLGQCFHKELLKYSMTVLIKDALLGHILFMAPRCYIVIHCRACVRAASFEKAIIR